MKILYIVPYAPTRLRTRPYNLIRFLARRGHALTLATLWETPQERQWLAGLAAEGLEVIAARLTKARAAVNVLRALLSHLPLQAAYCWQPELARKIASRFDRPHSPFDIVHVEHLRGAQYGLHLQSLISQSASPFSPFIPSPRPPLPSSPPILWDSVDCISLLFEQAARRSRSRFGRWATQFELARTRRYEPYLAGQFDRVLVTSPGDKQALLGLASPPAGPAPMADHPLPISVLPNGVDLEYFTPRFEGRLPNKVLLTGKMSYHANVTAALFLVHDVMPHLWAKRPDVFVEIAGHAPPREVRELAVRFGPRVSVTGGVPDLRPHLWSATLVAAPIAYGAGIQNKVLEALACGAPVVATPQAVSALAARAGEHLLVAAEAKPLAGQMLRLLDDEGLRQSLGRAGRLYVTEHHNWETISGRLEEHYLELAGDAA